MAGERDFKREATEKRMVHAMITGEHFIRAMAAEWSTARSHTEILTVPQVTIQTC
jgi:hypothetical protein